MGVMARVRGESTCFTQSWDACSCDGLVCDNDPSVNGTDTCIDECNARLVSDECEAVSANCDAYNADQCGSWCWNGLGDCPSCRDETCDIRPGGFCHGDPSCCKTSYCPNQAGLCSDCWLFKCDDSDSTMSVLGDPLLNTLTEQSLTDAITSYYSYVIEAGAQCECGSDDSENFCETSDMCRVVTGTLDNQAGLPYTPAMAGDFDLNCCAYCFLVDSSSGEC